MSYQWEWEDEECDLKKDLNKDLWKHFKVGDIVEFEGVLDTPLRMGIIKDISIPKSLDESIIMDIVCMWDEKEVYTLDMSDLSIGLGYDDLRFIRKINEPIL